MSMTAVAHLWFGTKPLRQKPKCVPDNWEELENFKTMLESRGVKLVHIAAQRNEDHQWALALKDKCYEHDWEERCDPFGISLPMGNAYYTTLANTAADIGWPFVELHEKLGWWLQATMY